MAYFVASLVVLAVTLGVKSENARARRIARDRRSRPLLERHPEFRPRDPSEPRDAIPAGYPGFPGSIRYVPYDTTADTEEK